MTEVDFQRRAAAFHEAGHAVLTYNQGGSVQFVRIDRPGTEISAEFIIRCTPDEYITVAIAGWLAQHKWHGRGGLGDDDDLLNAIEHARFGWDHCDLGEFSDDEHIFEYLLEAKPQLSDGDLISAYRQHQKRVCGMLKEPAIWAKIEAVAHALLRKDRLLQAEIESVLAGAAAESA